MSNLLSQEEINALLKEKPDADSANVLNAAEKDVLGEIANISMGSAATVLSSLLGKKTSITTPQVSFTTLETIREEYPQSYVTMYVHYNKGLEGLNVFVLHLRDACILVDLMLGGDGGNPPAELDESHLKLISGAMSQMMSASTSALTQVLKNPVEISAPVLDIATFGEDNVLVKEKQKDVMKIAFDLNVEGLINSEMMQILPVSFAKQLAPELYKVNKVNDDQAELTSLTNLSLEDTPQQVEVTSAQFPMLNEDKIVQGNLPPNLDLIMDIALQLSVELGRTKKKIKDILKLTNGSIVELDKLAGEPVDILVNGRILAKGEVIIIDENFGIRVTEIVSPTERIKNLK